MRFVRLAAAVLLVPAVAACSDPPQVTSGPLSGTAGEATATGPSGGAGATGASSPAKKELIAGIGYDPDVDPLVNPESLTQEYDSAQATEDDWLFVSLDGNPRTLNPLMASSTYEQMVNGFIYDGPFSFDRKMEWFVNDRFVEKFEESPDHRVWTIRLKKGLQWHDGHPFTAHDIQFSYEMIMNPAVVTVQRAGTDELESVKALDDLTVQYVHKKPLPTSKWNVLFSILPKHIYEKDQKNNPDLKTGDYYSKVNRQGMGSGPYRVIEWVENDKIVLERFDGHPGPRPHFKRVVCRIVPDQNVQLLTFEKGQLDETRLIPKQFADETVRSEAFKKVGFKARGVEWGYTYICWNLRGNPFFGDARVRRAMTHACDVESIIRNLGYNLYTPCYGIFHPASPMFNPEIKLLKHDPAEAARLLDEAGWKVSEEDGWRSRNGEKFSFTMLLPQGIPISLEVAAIVQASLKSLGVEMKTQVIEWAAFQERTRKHEFQANMAGWGTGVDPDLNWNLWHTEMADQEGGRNYGCYSNARVDELLRLGREEFDREKRMGYYRELQKIVYDDQPYTFIWNRPTLWAFNRRIRGVVFSPRGVWNHDPSYLAWWVHKSEQAHGSK